MKKTGPEQDASQCGMKKRRVTFSVTQLSVIAATVMLLMAMLVMGTVSVYYQTQFKEQYLRYIRRVQTQFNRDTSASFAPLEHQLMLMGVYNNNVSLISTAQDSQSFYRAKMALYSDLSNMLPVFVNVDGLFFYLPSADDYTPFVGRYAASECSDYIRAYLSANRETVMKQRDLMGNWKLVEQNNNAYLVRYVISGSSVLGAWVSLPTLLDSFQGMLPEESILCILDQDHRLFLKNTFSDYVFDESAELNYQEYTASDGIQYIVNAYKTAYSDCYLALFTPVSAITSTLSPVYKSGVLIALIVIVAVTLISIAIKHIIDVPIRSMRHALDTMQSENIGMVQLSTDSHYTEIRQLFDVLNTMLTKIQTLEARVYEEKLAQSRMELKFLKSQITPHFLINCLNTFSFLASSSDENDHATAQRLTQTLSQHIRYSFASGEVISLAQEFDHLDNYLELASIRYPGSLAYELSLPPECRDAQLPPMTLLTLCENTVKHNLIMGEWLKILISARYSTENGAQAVHICYIDSGTGYPPEVLEHCNHVLEHPEDVQDGNHIGIYNIVKQVQTVYKGKASFTFSNEPDAGARVDIYIPWQG